MCVRDIDFASFSYFLLDIGYVPFVFLFITNLRIVHIQMYIISNVDSWSIMRVMGVHENKIKIYFIPAIKL